MKADDEPEPRVVVETRRKQGWMTPSTADGDPTVDARGGGREKGMDSRMRARQLASLCSAFVVTQSTNGCVVRGTLVGRARAFEPCVARCCNHESQT